MAVVPGVDDACDDAIGAVLDRLPQVPGLREARPLEAPVSAVGVGLIQVPPPGVARELARRRVIAGGDRLRLEADDIDAKSTAGVLFSELVERVVERLERVLVEGWHLDEERVG